MHKHHETILELLGTFSTRGAYGLQLVERSAGRLKMRSVYVHLGQLEDRGYVNHRWDDSCPPRALWSRTGKGARYLIENVGFDAPMLRVA